MSHLRMKKIILRICIVMMMCMPLTLLAQGKGKGKKDPRFKCDTVTVDAVFDDSENYGIKSDGLPYLGLENAATVCILLEQDHDFILGTNNNRLDMAYGVDRKVTLDFDANNSPEDLLDLPFFPYYQVVDASIRVDEASPAEEPSVTRFIMWFEVDRKDYKLYFDGQQGASNVLVMNTTAEGSDLRQWTIESIAPHKARLTYGKGKSYVELLFTMLFQITVYETDKDPTCL